MDAEELQRWERFITTGLHAFLFVDHVAPDKRLRDVVDTLRGMIPEDDPGPVNQPPADRAVVLSAAETVGPYAAFVHLWAPPRQLSVLQDAIAGPLWEEGIRCDYSLQGTAYTSPTGQIFALKIRKCDVVAFVRIYLDAEGEPFDIMSRLSELDGFQGAATVFGSFDLLLVLDGEDVGDVAKVVMGPLRRIPGIARTETAFADYRRYDDDYTSAY
jgi:DNA-binding Lrp family transcriptional regulator